MSAKHTTPRWLGLGLITTGVLLVGIGIWAMAWAPETMAVPDDRSTSLPPNEPTYDQTRAAADATPARAEPATMAPNRVSPTPVVRATSTFTPLPTDTPTASIPEESAVALTVVHSNDTWGYILPCG